MRNRFLLALAASLLAAPSAQAANVCAWIQESNTSDGHMIELYLQSDKDIQGFDLVVGGKGVVTGSGASMSPTTATYALDAGKADKAWGMGTSINSPGRIDITVELRKSAMDDTPVDKLPLLAHYAFSRPVVPNEKKIPATLAKHQCAPVQL